MARADWPYGPCVDKTTRRLRYLAPTTLQKGDPNDHHGGGCLRKFFYDKVLGLKPEKEGAWLGVGKDCHAEIENYLITGTLTLGPISSAVKPYLPEPDLNRERLLIEHDIGGGDLAKASFGVDVGYRVPFLGYTDIIHANTAIPELGIKFGDPFVRDDGEGLFDDPPGTIEAQDWKFGAAKKGADRDFSLTPAELAIDTQMVTQGAWAMSRTPKMSQPIRLAHVYTNTKGRAVSSKASILIPRENLLKRWEYIRGATRTLADVVRETDPNRVPGNKFACESFGGCPYAGAPCQIPKDTGLEMFFGGDSAMAIIDELNLSGLTPTPNPAPVVPANTPAANLGLDIVAQMNAFMADTGGAPAAPAPAPVPAVTIPPEFAQAIDSINAKGYGMVPLAGAAAKLYAALQISRGHTGYSLDAQGFAGTGDLAKTATVNDPARIVGISREMVAIAVKPGTPPPPAPVVSSTPAPLGIVSPETPASNPALAAVPIEGFAHPSAVTPNVQVPGLIASVPGTQAAQILANTTPAAAPTNVAATVTGEPPKEEPKARRTRGPNKKKTTDGSPAASNEPGDDAKWLFINAIPNVAYEDCARFVSEWSSGAAKHFKLAAPYDDIRLAPNDSPIGFGKGLAALSSVAKNAAYALPPGAYYINTESELAAAVAEGFTNARVKNADGTDGDPVFELVVRGVPRG